MGAAPGDGLAADDQDDEDDDDEQIDDAYDSSQYEVLSDVPDESLSYADDGNAARQFQTSHLGGQQHTLLCG